MRRGRYRSLPAIQRHCSLCIAQWCGRALLTARRSRCSAPASSALSPRARPGGGRRRSRERHASREDVLLPFYRDHGAQFLRGVTHDRKPALLGRRRARQRFRRSRARIFPICVPIGDASLPCVGRGLCVQAAARAARRRLHLRRRRHLQRRFLRSHEHGRRVERCRWSLWSTTTSGRSRCRARCRPRRRRWRRRRSPPASRAGRSTATTSSPCAMSTADALSKGARRRRPDA